MGIQYWSENIILVELPAQEPEMGLELKMLIDILSDRVDCNVAMDFLSVSVVTSPSLKKLLKIRKNLQDCGKRIIFYNVAPYTKRIFTALEVVFEIADDKFVALAMLQLSLG